jgi:hypothetical protein
MDYNSIREFENSETMMIANMIFPHLKEMWAVRYISSIRNGFYMGNGEWAVSIIFMYTGMETGLWFNNKTDENPNNWKLVQCPTLTYVHDQVIFFKGFKNVANHMNEISQILEDPIKAEQAKKEALAYLTE